MIDALVILVGSVLPAAALLSVIHAPGEPRVRRVRGPRMAWHPSRRTVERFPAPCVYFVRRGVTDEVKVGFTARQAAERIREWSLTGMSEDAIPVFLVVGNKDLESAMHREFRRERIRPDREWFTLPAASEGEWRGRVERVIRAASE